MGLEAYWRKRHFEKTPEPRGAIEPRRGRARRFCVQKHEASHLHYDFRLELEGSLKSWAVPKGPSLDPKVRRLAMETEDHPLEYGDFEGIIPRGEYGGGTVLLWDQGTWIPLDDDPHRAYRAGKLHFELRGEKLRGAFLLERTWREGREGNGRAWRLTKTRDGASAEGSDITAERPESVATGRDLEAIASEADRVWRSNRGGHPGGEERRAQKREMGEQEMGEREKGERKKRAAPKRVKLSEPVSARAVPTKSSVHEIAIEGEHVLARIEGGAPSLEIPAGSDRRFPAVLRGLRKLGVEEALLDLWVADLEEGGTTRAPTARAVAFATDLLFLEGEDLRRRPFAERKRALEDLLSSAGTDAALRLQRHFDVDVHARACSMGAKEVWSRDRRAVYGEGFSRTACKPKRDRLLFREASITKSMLADYYRAVEEQLMPHLAGRPLTLVRADDAIEDGTMFLRHSKAWGPSALRRVRIQEKTKIGEYLVADDLEGVLALVHMGIVEIHTWNSVAPDFDLHDRVVLDLDPDSKVPWADVVALAKKLRRELAALGLESFVKTTGGKGLHVVAPIVPTDWATALAFSRTFAERIAAADPNRLTTAMALAKRPGKTFIDYLRNNRTNTSVAAFSTRARSAAPVSMPVSWAELGKIDPHAFTLATVPKIVARRRRDPWSGYEEARAALPASLPKQS